MGGSMSIKNDTDFPLLISLEQVTPLYWEVVQPGETFFRKTGAVHFTIKAIVCNKDNIDVFKDIVLPIAGVSLLSTGIAIGSILTFGAVGVGAVGTTAGVVGA
jgi:hypothetical protein